MNKVKIAVFASGSGSNFAALEEACRAGRIPADIVLMVTDKPDAYVNERAQQAGIPIAAFRPREFETKQAYEQAVLEALQETGAEWLILAGYMRLIGPVLLSAYPERIINIHPSLLPSFPGKDAIGQAVAAGVKVTGVTVHLVDEGMDTGPILAQRAVDVIDGDEVKTASAIHAVEHELYTETLQNLFKK
ncbi:phosphoribosylglycinamide formyltransferase [Sporosarcina sp. P37]|uniref:phosphoribosylglycinamide formyltransferase n=1 Tax=unclassified Sporosarcina TaxID=2647733 RepID=UPI000A17FC20|nr:MULTISPECIES: phosphoribosylglycinamide formyltransferase [unclassified Sporosarcina]ARK24348.1 phosphoribosylglycinamide formyltransferase [Sporosarcina sp. P37]PID16304.1 phosphoribosylglycinamide formyltransferase [Sporosarcina sp. P35]